MADRYQDRPLSTDGFGRSGDQQQRADGDPLAELARLIGQNNESAGRGNTPPPSHAAIPQNQFHAAADQDGSAGGPPPWMQRANRKEIPRDQQRDFQTDEPDQSHFQALSNALNRYGSQPPPVDQNFHDDEPSVERADERPDPSRYDDALFGQVNTGAHEDDLHHDNAFPEDPYAFQEEEYEDEEAEEREPKRRGGLMTVAAVLALAVIGTGAAFAYRTYVGSSRTGEPPIIKADNSPTKIVPTPQDGGGAKVPDRLAMGDGTEKLISREETPVDVNSRSVGGGGGGPRVVFPQLNQNSNPPSPSSVAPNGLPPASASNGTMANSEPRKIRTLSVRGDQPDAAAAAQAPASPPPPAGAKSAAGAKMARNSPSNSPSPANANASANAPMPISPQSAQDSVPPPAAEPRARVAATNPAQTEPAASPAASGGGGYLVQISSQRNEADAQASFKALQGKFPSVLGSQTPVIKRADLGEKGVYYRAMVGPFGTSDEAAQFCNSLRSAGGQCLVPRNQ